MKLTDIVNFIEIFQKMKEQKLPIKTSYKVVRLNEYLEKHYEFYRSTLQKIFEDDIQKDENGEFVIENNTYKVIPEKMEDCNKRIEELNLMDVEDTMYRFDLEELNILGDITPAEMATILPFLE